MFKNLKLIFSPKNKDIRKRISFTLIGLLIFALGTTIPVPGTEGAISSLGLWELYNAIGGGALKNFSIFALGVMPYISASIITGILQMDIVPYFTELKESGEQGRQKINQINRYLGIAIAFVQGFAMAFTFIKGASTIQYFEIAIILTGGTALLLWLGDQITQKGIGNGISLIIMAGIISTVPKMFIDTFSTLVTSRTGSLFIGIVGFSLFVLLYLLIVVGVVFEECSERRIPIQYSNRTTASYGGKQNYIPFKINSAGVMPVIFASVLLSIPTFIAGILGSDSGFSLFVSKYIDYSTPVGFVLYMILIFVFGYFYTNMQINPKELAKNLNRNGGYIPGIRPGVETENYIKKILNRITFLGSIFIAIIAGLPIVFSSFISTGLPASVRIGGTGVLIVVGVAIETCRQLESSLINRSYKGAR
ncbi:MAG: preprotein translocase subunit SecY [Bacilli bacterium]|nr:preprotein translocase subunit SecY [Bacilli bacterium]MDY5996884.1 preprotein translocase subunit SecY [Bacilli bacterium]